jgi:hypothetical protein
MNTHTDDPIARLCLLEGWLPLASSENIAQCWGYDGPGLERLILHAAPLLRQAPTLLAARAVLWHAYWQLRRGAQ